MIGGGNNPRLQVDDLLRLRLRIIQILAAFSIFTSAIGLWATVANNALDLRGVVTTATFIVLDLLVLVWARRQQYLWAASTLVLVYTLSTLAIPFAYFLMAILALVTAAIVGNRIMFLFANLTILGEQALEISRQFSAGPSAVGFDSVTILLAFVAVSISVRYFVWQAERATTTSRAGAAALEAVADIGQTLAHYLNLNDLLSQAVELIRERFAFYHVQVFLLNEAADQAQLVASTGELGQQLLSRQHQLRVGSQSVIGRVTATGEPVIARSTDPIYYRNELLPDTRSELAVPIRDGDKIIGALDVQSRRTDAFSLENIRAFQVMANLLATSIQNARLFEAQARSSEETKRLFFEAETNLREIRRLNQQLTKSGWEAYLRSQRTVSGITLENDRLLPDDSWSDPLLRAVQSRQPVTEQHNGSAVIAVPVVLGGEIIGAIEVEPGVNEPPAETVEMMKAIAQRLAISLDKARLFEESQQATAQEQRINEIVARFQSVSQVDDLLKVTLTELSQSLGAKHGAIRLSIPHEDEVNGGQPA